MHHSESNITTHLVPGDHLSFEKDKPVFNVPTQNETVTISFHDLCYKIKTKVNGRKVGRMILNQVSGIMRPGMNAILGPTGSGKTTLLDILAGRKDPKGLTGHVLVNGCQQPQNFKCMAGYVVQNDVVMGTLTVKENLYFSATLRLPSSFSRVERANRVNSIINELGLSQVADSKVGTELIRGISGGERKRTSIGMELITSPDVLFLDEPTTGLDASTANSVIQILTNLARNGKTIVFSIHQPRYSIYKQFEFILLISRGEIVYQGPAADTLAYFDALGYVCEEHDNPADFIIDVVTEDEKKRLDISYQSFSESDTTVISLDSEGIAVPGSSELTKTLPELYRGSGFCQNVHAAINPILTRFLENEVCPQMQSKAIYATSFFTQLLTVSNRAVKNIVRNPQTSIVQSEDTLEHFQLHENAVKIKEDLSNLIKTSEVVVVIIFALIVGAIYYQLDTGRNGLQNRVGAFFFIVMNQVFGNLSAIELFMVERPIFIHESAGGYYRVSSYFIAKVLCDLVPMRLIPILFFSSIVYFMIGFQMDVYKFLIFTLTLLLTSLCACGLSFFVSAAVSVFAIANLLVALPYVFMMVFGGVLVNLGSLAKWLSWIKYLSIFKYSIESLSINELKGMTFHCGRNLTGTPSCPTGDMYLKLQDINPDDLWYNELALGIMTLGLMLCAYVTLRCIKKEK